jgi:cytochrome b subunit of formate dehydrogenase
VIKVGSKLIGKIVHWAFGAVAISILITGFGITEYRAVESLTFGALSKALSFQLHLLLVWPFVVLLALHLYFTVVRKKMLANKNGQKK